MALHQPVWDLFELVFEFSPLNSVVLALFHVFFIVEDHLAVEYHKEEKSIVHLSKSGAKQFVGKVFTRIKHKVEPTEANRIRKAKKQKRKRAAAKVKKQKTSSE